MPTHPPTPITMPQLGESVVEGTVIRWIVQEGETLKEMDPLLEVSTDKVVAEVPSPAGGTLLKVLVAEGATVKAGTILAYIGQPGDALPEDATAPSPATASAAETHPIPSTAENRPMTAGRDQDLGFISPVVAKLAQEHNLDLNQVKGSGEGGRITKKDVLAYLEHQGATVATALAPAAWETPGDGDLFRPTEMTFPTAGLTQPTLVSATQPVAKAAPQAPGDRLIPLTNIRKAIADHMVTSVHTSPHVTTVMEADLSKVVKHRETNKPQFAAQGIHLTYTAYFIAAVVAALKAYPMVNSSWGEGGILVHSAIHIGVAVSLGEEGLIVPVIKNAGDLSLSGLARAVNDLAERARSKRLQPDEVRGGTFSITNHGTGSSLFATPIINQPQCAILGVGADLGVAADVAGAAGSRTEVYAASAPPARGDSERIEDEGGSSAERILAFLAERKLIQ